MMLNKSEYKVDSHLQAGVSLQLRFFSSAVWNTNEEETKHVIRVHFHISDAQNQTEPNRTTQNQAEPSRTTQPPPADWAVTSGEFRATLVRISRSLNGVVLLTLAQFLFSDPHFYFQEVDAVARRRRWSLIWKSAPSQKHNMKLRDAQEENWRPRLTKWDDLTDWIPQMWSGPSAGLRPAEILWAAAFTALLSSACGRKLQLPTAATTTNTSDNWSFYYHY